MSKPVNTKKVSFRARISKFFMGSRRRKVFFGGIALLVIFSIFNNMRKPDFEADLYVVKSTKLIEKVTASGEVMAEKAINLAFLQSGHIDEIYVQDGTLVSENEQLARIDATKLYQSYLSADAALRNTQANLDLTYDTVQGNETDESFAQRQLRTSSETAKDQAYRSLVVAQKSLSEGTLRAPFSGILNYVDGVSVGSFASAATPSFTLVDPNTVYFEAKVNELDVSDLSVNAKAEISLDAYAEEVFEQQIKSIGFVKTITSSGGTAYKVKVTLPQNIHNKFRLGMGGDVEFIVSESSNVTTVPISSIVEEGDETSVWIVGEGGKVSKAKVETGTSSLDEIEVISGLEPNDIVIERPLSTIQEGDKVSSKNEVQTQSGFLKGLF